MRSLRQPMRRVLDEKKMQVAAEPDGQLSKTDPDARSMAMSEFGPGLRVPAHDGHDSDLMADTVPVT